MKLKIVFFFFSFFLLSPAFSGAAHKRFSPLSKVYFALNEKTWVTTTSAQVTVMVHIAGKDQRIASLQSTVLADISRILPKQTWHVSDFQRQKGASGLETFNWTLVSRVPLTALNTLQAGLISRSKAGEQFVISQTDYAPSLAELEQARNALREKVYANVSQELLRLNAVYSGMHYYLYSVNFASRQPVYRTAQDKVAFNRVAAHPSAPAQAMGREEDLQAQVIIASALPITHGED